MYNFQWESSKYAGIFIFCFKYFYLLVFCKLLKKGSFDFLKKMQGYCGSEKECLFFLPCKYRDI